MDSNQMILISDMDDTLFDHEKHISDKNLKAIRAFQEKGGLFTVATGRSLTGFRPYLHMLNIEIPVILYNGSCIYDYGKERMLWMKALPGAAENYVRGLMEKFPALGMQIMTESGIYSYHSTPVYKSYMERENLPYIEIGSFEEISGQWMKAEMVSDMVDRNVLDAYLADNPIEGCRWLVTGDYSREIVAEDVSKGSAVVRYRELFGLDKKTLCCIGDHNNDYEMIRMADVGFAVGNALEKIKREADIIVADNEHDAVADALEQMENI